MGNVSLDGRSDDDESNVGGKVYFSGQNLIGLEELERSEYVPIMKKKVNP